MGQLEKYGLYVMCLVIFLILGVTLWGEPANANKTRAKKEAAMHASLGDSTNSLQNASFDRDQNGSGPASRGSQGVASLLGPEDNPPPYQPVDDGDLQNSRSSNGGGVIGSMIGGPSSESSRSDVERPKAQPTTQPKTQPEPVSQPVASRGTYKVRKGDSFARIARRELGSERHTALLASLNKKVNPAKLQIGQTLVLPSASELGQDGFKTVNKSVATGAYRTYTVSKGDTFDKIARVELGSIKRVKELRAMNSSVNPRKLQIGQVIKLPLK